MGGFSFLRGRRRSRAPSSAFGTFSRKREKGKCAPIRPAGHLPPRAGEGTSRATAKACFPRLRGKLPEGLMGGFFVLAGRRRSRAPSSAFGTFSREREKGKCAPIRPVGHLPPRAGEGTSRAGTNACFRLRGKLPEGLMGGFSFLHGRRRSSAPSSAFGTFSREREKGKCAPSALSGTFPRLRGKEHLAQRLKLASPACGGSCPEG